MSFELELKKGNFLMSECDHCKKIVWPPSEWCNQCLCKNSWRKCNGKGKIIEFSKKETTYFCVAEIENSIKIIGEIISGTPKIGQNVVISDCGICDDNYFFKMKMLD
ncbi:MAG: hypothetical protein OEM79_01710 [Nitrosopumilus sp.]|nr:hypothetical protein [Nitrosopumilus sp.]